MQCRLEVRDFRTLVRLGLKPLEKENPQEVAWNIQMDFPELPAGSKTDLLKDTIDYEALCTTVKKIAQSKHYDLIEAMSFEVYENLKKLMSPGVRLRVEVQKLNPPIDQLLGGTAFSLSDS
jgi:FolB domain-containing protein